MRKKEGMAMLDLQNHKEFLWRYTLSYGDIKTKKDDHTTYVFPFQNITITNKEDWETYKTPELKEQLFACNNLEEIFDFISLEYQDFYFMEISAHLHEADDQPLYSLLLKKTYENVGITEYITKNNYLHLLKFADEATAAYLQEQLDKQ